MPKNLTIFIVGILIVIAAVFFISRPPEKSDLPATATFGKPISMPMPKPPPERLNPPIPAEPGHASGDGVSPQINRMDEDMENTASGEAAAAGEEKGAAAEAVVPDGKEEMAADAGKVTTAVVESAPDAGKGTTAVVESAPEAGEETAVPEKATPDAKKETAAVEEAAPDTREKMTAALTAAPDAEETAAPVAGALKKDGQAASMNEGSKTRELKGIQVETDTGRTNIIIQADGPIQAVGPDKGFKYFFLIDPERLVVDLSGDWANPPSNGKAVENDLIQKLRFWKYPEKLRIVCDLKDKAPLTPSFMETADGLTITLIKKIEGTSENQTAQKE